MSSIISKKKNYLRKTAILDLEYLCKNTHKYLFIPHRLNIQYNMLTRSYFYFNHNMIPLTYSSYFPLLYYHFICRLFKFKKKFKVMHYSPKSHYKSNK